LSNTRRLLKERSITVQSISRTPLGVEMEVLTAVSIAALTRYDRCKAIDKGMVLSDIRLERKTGGQSGDYLHQPASDSI